MADYNSAFTGAQIDANLALAATATQPGDLGTAAFTASTDYATAAQGALADTAVQPADDAADLGSGAATDGYVLTADGAGGAAWEAAAGGGGTPGGTDTQVQFNDGGAFGGDSGFTFDKTNNTLGLGGGTITASDPIIDMAQTWNNGAVAFTAIKANVTDTASAAGSLLMDLQVGGVSKFNVGKGAGAIFATNLIEQRNGTAAQAFNLYNTYTDASNYERGFMRFVSNTLRIGTEKLGTGTARALELQTDGTTRITVTAANEVTFNSQRVRNGNFEVNSTGNGMVVGGGFAIATSGGGAFGALMYNAGYIGFASSTVGLTSAPDLTLWRDAADILAQRNGTTAQTSRLYGTYTDASNYRRLTKTMSTAGVAEIKPEGAGTGASGNVLHISGLPTSNPGPGILWNNAGTPAIGT